MPRSITLLRYWGSYFKSLDHAERIASYFGAATAAGWSCHLVVSQPSPEAAWLAPLSRAGITLHHVPRPTGNFDAGCVRATAQLCRRLGADIVHCDNTHTSPLIGAALARVPARLWTKHAMQPAFEEARQPTLRERLAPAVRTSVALASVVLPISRAIGDELIALGVSRNKIHVLPLPIAPVAAVVPPRQEARTRWGFRSEHIVFGTVGRALPVKGWDVLVEAFGNLHRAVPQSRLLLVGSTETGAERRMRERLDAQIAAAGLTGAVVFTGHLTNVGSALAAMDTFVLPSRAEGYSLALIEALAASLPVISTRVGIAPDIVSDEVHALLVERNDPVALTAALERLARDPTTRAHLAGSAATALHRLPSHQQHAADLFEIYRSLLNRSGRLAAS
jgi:glycosyltransferase involved in cell wall biosynthesis